MSDLLNTPASYGDDAIVTLTPREHIRLRPGMYIGKLGDGSQPDDGIYVLIKEVVDNSVDEFIMGAGKQIEITVADNVVTVRDYGRGIPLKSLAAAVSEMNTGGKYGGTAFKKTVGLNGVGVKAVNMLSSEFTARSVRDGEARTVTFAQGIEQSDRWESGVEERNGTLISFRVDEEVFGAYAYNMEYVEEMVKNYTYLNLGLTFKLNGQSYVSKNGLLDLLNEKMSDAPLYAPIHLSGDDIEVAITHGSGYGESYYSFVNGQYTSQGGTHQAAFREAIAKTVKEFYHKDYDASDIRTSIIAAISVKVTDPVFESQTKIKLGSRRSSRASRCATSCSISSASTSTTTCTSMPRRRRCCRRRSSRTRRSARRFRAFRRRRARRPRRCRSTIRSCATARYTLRTGTTWPSSR